MLSNTTIAAAVAGSMLHGHDKVLYWKLILAASTGSTVMLYLLLGNGVSQKVLDALDLFLSLAKE